MNIYALTRQAHGAEFTAVAVAITESKAIKMLGWEIDEDTTAITSRIIGTTADYDEWVVCEETW